MYKKRPITFYDKLEYPNKNKTQRKARLIFKPTKNKSKILKKEKRKIYITTTTQEEIKNEKFKKRILSQFG